MRNAIVCLAALLLILTASAKASGSFSKTEWPAMSAVAASPAAQKSRQITVPAGTRILIRTSDAIDSSKQKVGYRFTASLETNLQAGDVVVAPRGTTVYGRLATGKSAGRMAGSSELALELTDIVINSTAYPLLTSTYEVRGNGVGSNTAKKIIGGAGLGALIGGIAGGGKGAGIGVAAGAAGGTAIAASKKGQQVSVASETLLEFRLMQPAILPAAR